MKNLTKGIFVFTILILAAAFSFGFRSGAHTGSVKVYLKNKCSSDVEVYITQSGGGSKYTVEDGTEKPFSLDPGQKIYDEDQRNLIHEVTSSDDGATVIVCE
jgi:hypothetical protein